MVLFAFCAVMLLCGFVADQVARAIERWAQHDRNRYHQTGQDNQW